jgi:Restriction endonuclease BglII
MRYKTFSYRFAEQVLNSKLDLKREIEAVLTDSSIDPKTLSRPQFNKLLRELFIKKGWQDQPAVFSEPGDPAAKMDFLKDRVGIEVGFGHASFLGIDLLKFQVSSYSGLDKIDIGVYIATTNEFQQRMDVEYKQNWEGSLTFEKVVKYLPHFKSAIQVPIYVIGLEL